MHRCLWITLWETQPSPNFSQDRSSTAVEKILAVCGSIDMLGFMSYPIINRFSTGRLGIVVNGPQKLSQSPCYPTLEDHLD